MGSEGTRTAAASWRSPSLSRQSEPTLGSPTRTPTPTAVPAPERTDGCRKDCTAALQAMEPILSPGLSTAWTLCVCVCVCVCSVQMCARVCWMHPDLRTGTRTAPPPSPPAPFLWGFTCTLELAAPPGARNTMMGVCWGTADSTLEIKVPMGSGCVPALLGGPGGVAEG